jgi:hypothetical protein
MNKLTRDQWYELDEQMGHTPSEADAEGVPGEHMKLIALLNKFGFNPMSKHGALVLAEKLLDEGWEDRN